MSIFRIIAVLGLMFLTTELRAQGGQPFQGSFIIDRNIYNTQTDAVQSQSVLRLDVNPKRVRLMSDSLITTSRMMASIPARSIFLRHDKEDLLLVTGPKEAVQLTKGAIDQFSGMMQQFGARMAPRAESDEVIKTGETEYVMGYLCEKIAVRRPQRDEVTFVWVTDSVKVNWGILTQLPAEFNFTMSELFDRAWLDTGSFPMLAITFRGGKVRSRMEVVDMVPNDPDSVTLDVERGVQTIALSDYLFSNMWRR